MSLAKFSQGFQQKNLHFKVSKQKNQVSHPKWKIVRVQMQLNFEAHPRYFYFSLYRGVDWTFSKTPIKFSVCNNQPKLSKTISTLFFFFNKNVVFPAQAEYSHSSADFRLKILQYYSQFIAHDISVLDYTGGISYSSCFLVLLPSFSLQRME